MHLALSGSKEDWKKRTIYQLLTDRYARTDGSTRPCNNLGKYCGGSYRGLINNLDYIQGMGFDAIWISPMVDNFEDGYHGYWAKNWSRLNDNFGSEQDFIDFVNECHKRNIWVMGDVVANHVGPTGIDYSRVYPFNQDYHYHTYCEINGDDWQHNQWRVENCRLADLPDLKQEDSFVGSYILDWVKNIINKYHIDGLRIDTTPEVPKWFWDQYSSSAGVFTIGEVFDGRMDYVNSYIGHLDSVLNYPLYFSIKSTFKGDSFQYNLVNTISAETTMFGNNLDYMGVFLDNHDNPRFMNSYSNDNNLLSAMAFCLFFRGIPIMYYGDEQGYGGGSDPGCREQLWTNMNPNHPNYLFLKKVIAIRKQYHVWDYPYQDIWHTDRFLAFTRGNVLVIVSSGSSQVEQDVFNIPYPEGTVICNQLKQNDCLTIGNKGTAHFSINPDETKIYTRN